MYFVLSIFNEVHTVREPVRNCKWLNHNETIFSYKKLFHNYREITKVRHLGAYLSKKSEYKILEFQKNMSDSTWQLFSQNSPKERAINMEIRKSAKRFLVATNKNE